MTPRRHAGPENVRAARHGATGLEDGPEGAGAAGPLKPAYRRSWTADELAYLDRLKRHLTVCPECEVYTRTFGTSERPEAFDLPRWQWPLLAELVGLRAALARGIGVADGGRHVCPPSKELARLIRLEAEALGDLMIGEFLMFAGAALAVGWFLWSLARAPEDVDVWDGGEPRELVWFGDVDTFGDVRLEDYKMGSTLYSFLRGQES
jgi:hypothetical protein